MQGRGKTAAESRDGVGLACSAPCAGLSARLASGFCGVSGPPHPAPRPSQPLPAARNAKKWQVPRGWALKRPLAIQQASLPEAGWGPHVWSYTCIPTDSSCRNPIPPIQKLVFWLEQHLETQILKSQIPASLCHPGSVISTVRFPLWRRKCALSSLDGITIPPAQSEHKFSDIFDGCSTWAFLTGWTYDLYSARE